MSSSSFLSVAQAFVEARSRGLVVRSYPGPMPSNLSEAYAIQDHAIGITSRVIAAWKVGRIADELVSEFGDDRIAGPIFSDMIVDSATNQVTEMPVLPGFAAVEAELMMRVSTPIPAGTDLQTIADFIDEVRFGLEIASSPFPDINAHGPAVTASDFGNNFGLLLGPPIANWRQRNLLDAPAVVTVDGAVVGAGSASTMLDGPFGAVAFLARVLADRGIPIPPGTWVSTGAITGVHRVSPGQLVTGRFDEEYEVKCRTAMFMPAPTHNGSE